MRKHLSKLPYNFKFICCHPWLDMQATLHPENESWSLFVNGQEIDAEDWFETNAIQAIINFMGMTTEHQHALFTRLQTEVSSGN